MWCGATSAQGSGGGRGLGAKGRERRRKRTRDILGRVWKENQKLRVYIYGLAGFGREAGEE